MSIYIEPRTLGAVRKLLEGLADSTEVFTFRIESEDFVILVDSNGNAQRVVTKRHRTLYISLDLPISS